MARRPTITNEQILQAAREIFLAQGFDASTVDIAKMAGVSEGSIFKRFATKEELFFAAMGIPERPAWTIQLESLPGQGDLKENLMALALQIIDFFQEVVPQLMMLRSRGHAPPPIRNMQESPPAKSIKALTVFFDRELKLGRLRLCDPEIAARMFLGSLMNYVFLAEVGGNTTTSMTAPTYVRGLIEIFWQGIAPHEST